MTATNTTAPAESTEERLRKARERASQREDAALERSKRLELLRFDLLERFEKELGTEGRDFAIVDVTRFADAFVVVKLGDASTWKAFSNSKMSEMDADHFVTACVVYPEAAEYRAIVKKHPALIPIIARDLAALFGLDTGERQKK